MVPCQEQSIFSRAVLTIVHPPGLRVALPGPQVLTKVHQKAPPQPRVEPPVPNSGGNLCTALTRHHLLLRKDFSAHE